MNIIAKLQDSDLKRFWKYVTPIMDDRGCWEWTGYLTPSGYGVLGIKGKLHKAHRISWILHNGKIQDDLHVCHLCDNRSCVKPAHLWLGTHRDNIADRDRKGRGVAPPRLDTCSRGHDMSNPYIHKGHRRCRECKSAAMKKWWRNHRDKKPNIRIKEMQR